MPELPEVETTVLSLKEKVLKRTFVSVWAEKKDLKSKDIKGERIEDIERVGKGIFLSLDGGKFLFIHLKMTGHLLYGKWSLKKGKWVGERKILNERKNGFLRYIFTLDNGKQLALSDPRKFAKILIFSKKEKEDYVKKIGPDTLFIKKDSFLALLENKKREIKPLLMDQQVVSGIGNIYAGEILFQAKIDPRKKANLLKKEELEKIYNLTKKTIKKAIKLKGDSTSDYRLLTGEKGGYQRHHLVYKRKGEDCFTCKKKISYVKVGGRGTYYCPKCQKK